LHCWLAARGIGTQNVDFRLRQTDAGFDAARSGTPWLGMPIAELARSTRTDRRVLPAQAIIRCSPQRLRQAAKRGAQITC
jgi:NADH-quinone oxidoreductase subunit G